MLFSVITVVYNGASLLGDTIESVLGQTYPNIEYIIIDGQSKDETKQIIEDYAAKMANIRWISEPDKGLYDAMNKGLCMATGDFICFLNAGDHLYAPETIAQAMEKVTPETGVLYGDTMLVDDARKQAGLMSVLSTRALPKNLDWHDYKGGMLVVHQSFYARRSLAAPYITDNLCADFDWCIEILKQSKENIHTGLIHTSYLMGGMSKTRHQQSLKDRFWVMRKHFGLSHTVIAHVWIVVRAIGHRLQRWGGERY
jgi:glycosyltransferase involved in cell wall biosynthesis